MAIVDQIALIKGVDVGAGIIRSEEPTPNVFNLDGGGTITVHCLLVDNAGSSRHRIKLLYEDSNDAGVLVDYAVQPAIRMGDDSALVDNDDDTICRHILADAGLTLLP